MVDPPSDRQPAATSLQDSLLAASSDQGSDLSVSPLAPTNLTTPPQLDQPSLSLPQSATRLSRRCDTLEDMQTTPLSPKSLPGFSSTHLSDETPLTQTDWARLLDVADCRHLTEGECLGNPETMGPALFQVSRGRARVTTLCGPRYYGPGDMFGEMSFLGQAPDGPVYAEEASSVHMLRGSAIQDLIAGDAVLGQHFYHYLAQVAAKKLSDERHRLVEASLEREREENRMTARIVELERQLSDYGSEDATLRDSTSTRRDSMNMHQDSDSRRDASSRLLMPQVRGDGTPSPGKLVVQWPPMQAIIPEEGQAAGSAGSSNSLLC